MKSHFSGLPGHNTLGIYALIAVTEPLGKDLIPHSIIDPGGSFADIRRIHPGHDEIREGLALSIHLFFCIEAILKVVHYFLSGMEFEIILAPLIFRPECGGPPDVILKPFLEADFFLLPAPALISAHYSGIIRITIVYINFIYVISCFDIDDQMLCIQWIAVLL